MVSKESSSDKEPSVRPVIRQGILVTIKNPTTDLAIKVLDRLARDWNRFCHEYEDKVVTAVNKSGYRICFIDSEPWKHREGSTYVMDFPRLQYYIGDQAFFNTRICIAICTKEKSTKVWSRVSLPLQEEKLSVSSAIPLKELKSIAFLYRKINTEACKWMYGKLKEVISEKYPDRTIIDWGWLEISSLGGKDEYLARFSEELLNSDITAAEILREPGASKTFLSYFRPLSQIRSLDEFAGEKKTKKWFWFSIPIPIESESGHIELRQVLYLMRKLGSEYQAIGIGYDDSIDGDLALKAAAKAARWIGEDV